MCAFWITWNLKNLNSLVRSDFCSRNITSDEAVKLELHPTKFRNRTVSPLSGWHPICIANGWFGENVESARRKGSHFEASEKKPMERDRLMNHSASTHNLLEMDECLDSILNEPLCQSTSAIDRMPLWTARSASRVRQARFM